MGEAIQVTPLEFKPERKKAALVLFSVTLIWGATFVWMKQALDALDAELALYGSFGVVALLVAGRFFIATVLVFCVFSSARAGLRDPEVWKGGGLLGGILLVGFVSQMIGLDSINPSTSAFLTSLYIVFTALISRRLGGKPLTRMLVIGVLLATFGAGFIEGPPHLSWGWGEVLTVGSATFFALHIIYTDIITAKQDPLAITLSSFLVVTAGALLLFLFSGQPPVEVAQNVLSSREVVLPLIYLGVGGSFFCLVALNMYQRHLHPVQAAIIYGFEPVWATLFGLGLGMVEWTWWILVGGGALLLGNLLVEMTVSTPQMDEAE